jgi:ribosomal protein L31
MKNLKQDTRNSIEKTVDRLFDRLSYYFLGFVPKRGKKIYFFTEKPQTTLANLFVQAMRNRSPNEIEKEAAKGLLKTASKFIESLKEKTANNIIDKIDALHKESHLKQKDVNISEIKDILNTEMSKAKSHFKMIAETESTKTRNTGIAMDIAKINTELGIQDPLVAFSVVRDNVTCKHCLSNHLHPDGTPKVFRLSEVKQSYLSSEDRKSGEVSVCGQHPHCFTGDQKILTSEGVYSFLDLFESQKPVFATVDNRVQNKKFPANQFGVPISGTQKFNRHASGSRFLPTTAVYNTGVRKCLRFHLSDGRTIEVSEDHNMWVDTDRGGETIKAKDLKIDHKIPILSGPSGFGSDNFPEYAELMGNLMGDGSLSDNQVASWNFFGKDLPYGKTLHELYQKLTGMGAKWLVKEPGKKYRVQNSRFSSLRLGKIFFNDFGLSKKPRRVPKRLWTANKNTISAFLRGLYAADGHVEALTGGVSVVLSQNELEFLKEIQILLNLFNIRSRIFPMYEKTFDQQITYADGRTFNIKRKKIWRLVIGNFEGCEIFQKDIGLGVPAKNERLEKALKMAFKLEKKRFGWRTSRVVKIEDIGYQQTYCLTEPSVNTITVNGIVTGQCRCSMFTVMPGFGFKNGRVAWVGIGHDEYKHQKEKYGK